MTINYIKKACNNLGLKHQDIDEAGVFIKVELDSNKFHFFIANNLGLNDEVVYKINRDKVYTHNLLDKYIKMPRSTSYVDTQYADLYQGFSKFESHDEIVSDIVKNNSLPVIIKPNSKEQGTNVFCCQTKNEVENAVKTIFDKKSFNYDHVLLVEGKIDILEEFRIVFYKGKVQFIYQKDNKNKDSKFSENLSPLHFENARAVLISEKSKTFENLNTFIQPIFQQLNIVYGGLDVAIDNSGDIYLFEINSNPGFSYFVRDNSEKILVEMFEKIIKDLL